MSHLSNSHREDCVSANRMDSIKAAQVIQKRGREYVYRKHSALDWVNTHQTMRRSVGWADDDSDGKGSEGGLDVDYMQSESILALQQLVKRLAKQQRELAEGLRALEALPAAVQDKLDEADRQVRAAEERARKAEMKVDAMAENFNRLEFKLSVRSHFTDNASHSPSYALHSLSAVSPTRRLRLWTVGDGAAARRGREAVPHGALTSERGARCCSR
jgi:hypothetical protein